MIHPSSVYFELWVSELLLGDMLSCDRLRHNSRVYLGEALRSVNVSPAIEQAALRAAEVCQFYVAALEADDAKATSRRTILKQKAALAAIAELRKLVEGSPVKHGCGAFGDLGSKLYCPPEIPRAHTMVGAHNDPAVEKAA